MTPRGIAVLSDADIVAAEDTRHSRGLLTHFDIRTPAFSCHKFNEEKRGNFFVEALMEGKNVALISDAGTPCISDPGHKLVSMAAEAGIEVVAVPGACAVTAALSVSGFDASKYVFIGFLPRATKELTNVFDENDLACPLVFYESPLRISKTMEWLSGKYPNADVCLCNDLTKKFEKVYRGTPENILSQLKENPNAQKGEYACVLMLNAPIEIEPDETKEISLEAQLADIMISKTCTLKDATSILHKESKAGKKAIYAAALRLKELF